MRGMFCGPNLSARDLINLSIELSLEREPWCVKEAHLTTSGDLVWMVPEREESAMCIYRPIRYWKTRG